MSVILSRAFLTAFVCHHNTYLIYASLHKRSLTRFTIVTRISVSTSFLFCLVLGLAGFLTFIQETQGEAHWMFMALSSTHCGLLLPSIKL